MLLIVPSQIQREGLLVSGQATGGSSLRRAIAGIIYSHVFALGVLALDSRSVKHLESAFAIVEGKRVDLTVLSNRDRPAAVLRNRIRSVKKRKRCTEPMVVPPKLCVTDPARRFPFPSKVT